MPLEYSVTYNAENLYDSTVDQAVWQFLIIPENNESQELISVDFNNSLHIPSEDSINGYGFRTFRLRPRVAFNQVSFSARFKLLKKEVNPFGFQPANDFSAAYELLQSLPFKAEHEPYLRATPSTLLPDKPTQLFKFDTGVSLFDNLQALNHWVYMHLYFQAGVTHVNTTLEEVIECRKGVCQDFTHLFCALGRVNGVPVRYVSGYLHQGNGYFGDSQMHAWAEAFVPEAGWVGFDPTNDILAGSSHIKVAHGKDYQDCAPIKGVIFGPGTNQTEHSVEVSAKQAQQ
jgi:transglutaminase-like putative cysteine protease